ncbi:MAG: BMP family ABC transporter substrate-binding protein [bacterium]
MGSRWTRTLVLMMVVALLATAAFVVSACGAEETTTTVAPATSTTGAAAVAVKKIGVIVPEKANDYGWNQQHADAAKRMADKIGAGYVLSDGAGYGDPGPVMRQLVQEGCDWIIAGASGYNTVAAQIAQETKVRINIIGSFEAGNIPDIAQDFETMAQEGAYLAGVLAAMTTKTGTVGVIISADDENWNKMAGGFITAAKATKADIKIKLAQVGEAAYADAPAAKRTTETVIAEGADVIFGMGDGSSFGMIQACETATPPSGADKVWFIDVIGDKTSLDTKGIYLTSVVWDYLPAWEAAYEAIQAGTFGTEIKYIDLKNNGIGILKTQWIPDDVWTAIETAKAGIIDGSVEVPIIDKKADLENMIK